MFSLDLDTKGWLNPKALTRISWEVRGWNSTRMGDLPSMVHSIILGYHGELDIFNQPCRNLGACPWGRYMQVGLSAPIQCVHLWKEAIFSRGTLILLMPSLGLHKDLDQLENEATPYFMLVATVESCFLLSWHKVTRDSKCNLHMNKRGWGYEEDHALSLCDFLLNNMSVCVKC